MSDSPARTALITGASVGIGYELAKLFARDRYNLVLVARNADRLQEVASELRALGSASVYVLEQDLSSPDAPQQIFDELKTRTILVDTLVNNAGFGTHGPFAEADTAAQLGMLQVNIAALTHLTRLFLPGMVERRAGRVMNVASTAAFQPGPYMSVYYASKAYVLSFSEAIAVELNRTGVTVTALCPGPTITEFQKRAGIENTRLLKGNSMSAEAVARAGYAGMLAGRRVVIPGMKNRALAAAVRFAPRKFVTRVVAKLNKNRK